MALFRVFNERAQFDAAGNDASDQYGAGIRFTQGGNARVTTGSATNYNQGIPMSATGQVAIVDATAGLPAGTIFHNGLPISGDKVCVSRNATAVVSNGLPYDAAGAVAGDINLDLNFIGTDTLNSSVTFTRASSATFTGSNGLIQSATTNTPRFDYDPVTLAAKGLLIEEQRTNLLTYSEDFTNAVWALTRATLTSNTAVAPDGTTSADKVVEDTSTGTHVVSQSVTLANATYTASVYLKAAERTFATFQMSDLTTGGAIVFVNLSTGVIVSTANTGSWTAASSTISNQGNGWYRVTVTGTKGAGTVVAVQVLPAIDGSTNSYTGNGTSGVLVWGAQLEAGSFATSYIPTVASQVTRSADVASVNTLSLWYNATEGTLYAEASVYAGRTSGNPLGIASITDETVNNRLTVAFTNNALSNQPRFVAGGVSILNASGGTATLNVPSKIAAAYRTGNTASYANGTQVETSSTAFTFSPNKMNLGAGIPVTEPLCGHIRRITYYPRRLSNAELQAITA